MTFYKLDFLFCLAISILTAYFISRPQTGTSEDSGIFAGILIAFGAACITLGILAAITVWLLT